jgi:signal transduction histidine kinase
LDHDISLCVFRLVQEALRNAITHSDARHVSIDLMGVPPGLTLTIADDGKGFDAERVRSDGLGLIAMRERVESVGGTLEIHSAPGSGTTLRFVLPLHAAATESAAMLS